MTKTRVCPVAGCPQLTPCATHSRERSHWSPDRDRGAQRAFRASVLARDSHTCQRCRTPDPTGKTLQAHHLKPGYNPAHGITLCRDCHREVDRNAR